MYVSTLFVLVQLTVVLSLLVQSLHKALHFGWWEAHRVKGEVLLLQKGVTTAVSSLHHIITRPLTILPSSPTFTVTPHPHPHPHLPPPPTLPPSSSTLPHPHPSSPSPFHTLTPTLHPHPHPDPHPHPHPPPSTSPSPHLHSQYLSTLFPEVSEDENHDHEFNRRQQEHNTMACNSPLNQPRGPKPPGSIIIGAL